MPNYYFSDPARNSGSAFDEDVWVLGDGHVFQIGTDGPKIGGGSGSPNGVYAWPMGSIFLRTDTSATSALYVKQSVTAASTGWILK